MQRHFRNCIEPTEKKILNYVYRMTGSRDEAEDLMQDTFVLAYRKLKSLKENARFPKLVVSDCPEQHISEVSESAA